MLSAEKGLRHTLIQIPVSPQVEIVPFLPVCYRGRFAAATMSTGPTRKRLELFKYGLYAIFPIFVGYGLGRAPAFWERMSELARLCWGLDVWAACFDVPNNPTPLPPALQLPSAAANPSGPYLSKEATAQRPTLHSGAEPLCLLCFCFRLTHLARSNFSISSLLLSCRVPAAGTREGT